MDVYNSSGVEKKNAFLGEVFDNGGQA